VRRACREVSVGAQAWRDGSAHRAATAAAASCQDWRRARAETPNPHAPVETFRAPSTPPAGPARSGRWRVPAPAPSAASWPQPVSAPVRLCVDRTNEAGVRGTPGT
jgi:hypothetical protein